MFLQDFKNLKSKEIFEGFTGKFIHTSTMTFAYWDVKAGSIVPAHTHLHEQVAQVLEGTFILTVADEILELKPGNAAVIPPYVKHSGVAVTDCKLLDVFCPVREDYRI